MQCGVCETDDGLNRECSYCGQVYCTTHRLPEKHDCPSLMLADDETLDDIGKQTVTELRHVAARTEANRSGTSTDDDAPLDLTDEQLRQLQEAKEASPDNPADHHEKTDGGDDGGILQRIRSLIPFIG